jgi:CheY-like chemotaxis protein
MKRFLIVDDSPVDRLYVTRLLHKLFDATVVQCHDGAHALRCLATDSDFDMILSDLCMPELDGLGLLAAVREQYARIPFVILTGNGSEEIASQAIIGGAANYVTKLLMHSQLPDVVTTVLAAASRRQVRRELTRHTVCHELEFKIPNDRNLISAVIAELQDIGLVSGVFKEHELTRVGVGLEEALSNAMIHGNLEVSSIFREPADGSYERLIEERQRSAPYRDRRIHVRSRFTPFETRFVVADEGPGFDTKSVPDPTDPENFLKASGRGLLLIRAFMNEAYHNETGNEITMVKRGCDESIPEAAEADSCSHGDPVGSTEAA